MTADSPLSPVDFYHVGIIVPDIAEAAARLSRIGGYEWTKAVAATQLTSFAYDTDNTGLRIEIVDRALFPTGPASSTP